MKRTIKYISIFLIIVMVGSCSLTRDKNELGIEDKNVERTEDDLIDANEEKESFFSTIYDTCGITERNRPPSRYWLQVDRSDNYRLTTHPDSVVFAWLQFGVNNRETETKKGVKLSDVHKCHNLGFLDFEEVSSTFNESWPTDLDFKNFPELRYVDVGNQMTEQQFTDLVCTAKNLKGLSVKLSAPVSDCLCELNDLEYLEIVNYGNVMLPSCMNQMKNLKYLSLLGEGVGGDDLLNEVIWNIPSLEFINIGGGRNVNIKSSVKNMIHLKHLEISSVDSISFSDEFSSLDSLELIVIRWVNKKIDFPHLDQLSRLKGVSIAQVKLVEFPSFGEGSEIQYIHFTGIEELDNLKMNFSGLNSLETLYLNGLGSGVFLPLTSLPDGIVELKSLKSLELNGFNISVLPDELFKMGNLTHLTLSGSKLEFSNYLSIYQSPELDNLRSIYLNYRPPEEESEFITNKIRQVKNERLRRTGMAILPLEYKNSFIRSFYYYKNKLKYHINTGKDY